MNQIIDRDHGYNALMKLASQVDFGKVTVGIHDADASKPEGEDSDVTVGEVAAVHEFGLGVPRRSWLRDWVDGAQDEIRKTITATAAAIVMDPGRREQMLERLALWAKAQIQKRIIAGIEPELTEETKARKAKVGGKSKDTPLIFTGQFIGSIDGRVEK